MILIPVSTHEVTAKIKSNKISKFIFKIWRPPTQVVWLVGLFLGLAVVVMFLNYSERK